MHHNLADMVDAILQNAPFLLVAGALGAGLGWLVCTMLGKQKLDNVRDEMIGRLDEAVRQRDGFNAENIKLRATIESMQAVVHKHEVATAQSRVELQSAAEKIKILGKEVVAARGKTDELEAQLNNSRSSLATANYQVSELESEFEKAGIFYKGELAKAFEKRKAVEVKLDDSKAERESLTALLEAAKTENESVNKMLVSTQTRLNNLEHIEKSAIELKAENAELRHEAARSQQQLETMRHNAAELEELKLQNKELSHCLQSMENSRRQYEQDAKRYRDQAEHSEQLSDTLRIKLDDVEKNLAKMAKQEKKAEKHIVQNKSNGQGQENGKTEPQADREVDDLTRIVGIGKVFQHTLHKLGIYSFRQLANFGPEDIARVNAALKENKGRMEQDDWIGQAKELYYQKRSEQFSH